MNYQFASTYSVIIVMYLLALFLFLRYEKDNKARLFLGISYVLFGTSMLYQFIYSYIWNNIEQSGISMSSLLITSFICTLSLVYPLQIISTKTLQVKKILKLFTPFFFVSGGCIVIYLNDSQIRYYTSVHHFFGYFSRMEVSIYILIFTYIAGCLVYTIFLLLRNRNVVINSRWFCEYLGTFVLMNLFYVLSLFSNTAWLMISNYLFVLCCAYITYLELYERESNLSEISILPEQMLNNVSPLISKRVKGLRIRLVEYMETEKAWRDPDITVKDVTTKLRTNRRVLNSVVQEMGYDNFPSYINYLRVKDFTEIIENSKDDSFQNIFFNVGFKSRATAHRNFKNIKGLSPSEYYDSIKVIEED